MTSLSSRKSWDIFALSIEKIDFLIFSYFNLRVYLWALIHKQGYIRSRNCNFFLILHSQINNSTLALFWFRPYFPKFFTLKLNVLKNAFGTRTLKPYRTVNTHPKVTINSSFWRKLIAKIYSATYLIQNDNFLLICGQKHDFSKRHLKWRILTLFLRFFWPEITSKKFKSNIFRLNLTRAFVWSYLVEKKFWSIFARQDPYHKKKSKFFC